jgi:hypothetical protein
MNEDGSGPIGLVNLFIILAIPVYFQVCFLFFWFFWGILSTPAWPWINWLHRNPRIMIGQDLGLVAHVIAKNVNKLSRVAFQVTRWCHWFRERVNKCEFYFFQKFGAVRQADWFFWRFYTFFCKSDLQAGSWGVQVYKKLMKNWRKTL